MRVLAGIKLIYRKSIDSIRNPDKAILMQFR